MDTKTTTQNVKLRTPIVTVLGHVDHGKTTLLDKIRNTTVAAREAGGITQGIGASVVTTKKGQSITFIDTPGHAAFSNMRASGSKIADVAILVVSSVDGFKPQTKEALEYILKADIPFIVAATKADLPTTDIELVKSDLEKEGVQIEGRGGDVPVLAVSGKSGIGVEELLDMILLVCEMHEISGSADENLEAYVFETGKDKRGPFVSIVVKNGKLAVGDLVVTEDVEAKVRGIFDENNNVAKEVMPGYPAQIIGFPKVPGVGSRIWSKQEGGAVISKTQNKPLVAKLEKEEVGVFIKAQNSGALDAVLTNLPKKSVVVGSGVGEVNDSDVFLAKSMGADIYVFESKVPSSVGKLAETEGVKIHQFNIIYELFETLEKKIKGGEAVELGKAEIVAVFPFNNKKVAGSKVTSGKITKNDKLTLMRGEKELGQVKLISLKKNKVDINEAKQGEEFGAIFVPQLDFTIGDVIISLQ